MTKRRLMMLLLVIVPLSLAQTPAVSAPRWQMVEPDDPGFGSDSSLTAVDCPEPDFCFAVGSFSYYTLAERWDGSEWHVVPSPNPTARTAGLSSTSGLPDVSCPTSTFCMMTGNRWHEDHPAATPPNPPDPPTVAYAASWNGKKWTLHPPVWPSDASSPIKSVSCSSPSFCMAVGYSFASTAESYARVMVQVWRGGRWRLLPVPPRLAGAPSLLSAVDCPADDRCVAVGAVGLSERTPLALRWNGKSWVNLAVPLPANATAAALTAVDCRRPLSCLAAGEFARHNKSRGFAVELSKKTWSLRELPNLWFSPDLADVSCSRAGLCVVAGWVNQQFSVRSSPLALIWDGSSWDVDRPPVPDGTEQTRLTGVSCQHIEACFAVGMADDEMLIERYRE